MIEYDGRNLWNEVDENLNENTCDENTNSNGCGHDEIGNGSGGRNEIDNGDGVEKVNGCGRRNEINDNGHGEIEYNSENADSEQIFNGHISDEETWLCNTQENMLNDHYERDVHRLDHKNSHQYMEALTREQAHYWTNLSSITTYSN